MYCTHFLHFSINLQKNSVKKLESLLQNIVNLSDMYNNNQIKLHKAYFISNTYIINKKS